MMKNLCVKGTMKMRNEEITVRMLMMNAEKTILTSPKTLSTTSLGNSLMTKML